MVQLWYTLALHTLALYTLALYIAVCPQRHPALRHLDTALTLVM